MPNPGGANDAPSFPLSEIKRLLGEQAASLIDHIAQGAQERDLPLYLAGGVVRDLIMGQRNVSIDLDFVVEGDAISFAMSLAIKSGGSVQEYEPFGTATWTLDSSAGETPAHVDFACARSETYSHPAALPTVSPSDMQRDLLRRDFSVNALAIQLSPRERSGILLDRCGGGDDLKLGLIRALHQNSFVDDPTRILRAARYASRLDFVIEATTEEWMRAALSLLGRVSGQRLQNEIDLILREGRAGEVLLRLQKMGALAKIHPAFRVSSQLPELLERCNELRPPWPSNDINRQALRWIALFTEIDADEARSVCERLALRNKLTHSIVASARLAERISRLEDRSLRPSQVTKILDDFADTSLQAAWLLSVERPYAQDLIAAYATEWRQRRATTTGNDLKARGIAPGPHYRRILDRLRFAWIDGDARSVEEERQLLQKLLEDLD
ncbi:MAG: hypothetical protein OXG23_07915 [Chloroflexi bacterium]|nr:hypothetical protein [Chloroflexota bacterium]